MKLKQLRKILSSKQTLVCFVLLFVGVHLLQNILRDNADSRCPYNAYKVGEQYEVLGFPFRFLYREQAEEHLDERRLASAFYDPPPPGCIIR